MDALRGHLKVLGLHWLASVKDAVRLNQVRELYRSVTEGFRRFFLCKVRAWRGKGVTVTPKTESLLEHKRKVVRPFGWPQPLLPDLSCVGLEGCT